MRTLLENLASRIDPEDELSGPDLGEAKVVVVQAVGAGWQGHRIVPGDVAADRAFGYLRDRGLVSRAIDELVREGKVDRGRDGELSLVQEGTPRNGAQPATVQSVDEPEKTRFKVGRRKRKKKRPYTGAIEGGNDPVAESKDKGLYVAYGKYDSSKGYKIDGHVVRWWGSKAEAKKAARAIGWPVNSLEKVHTRFQSGWAIGDTRFGLLTREGYGKLFYDRNPKKPEPGVHARIAKSLRGEDLIARLDLYIAEGQG